MGNKLWLLFLAVFPCICTAQNIIVKTDGTGDYDNIQAAVDAAQSNDTVIVHPGTYTGPATVTFT